MAEVDFGGTVAEQQTVVAIMQEQLSTESNVSSSGSFDTNSFSTGSSSSSGSNMISSSQQEQFTQSTGNTFAMEQQEQSTGQVQTALQVTEVIDSGPVVSAFEVAEEQSATEELTFEDGSTFGVADQNFGTSFDDKSTYEVGRIYDGDHFTGYLAQTIFLDDKSFENSS